MGNFSRSMLPFTDAFNADPCFRYSLHDRPLHFSCRSLIPAPLPPTDIPSCHTHVRVYHSPRSCCATIMLHLR